MTKRYRAVAKWRALGDIEHHEVEYVDSFDAAPSAHEIQDYLYECYGHLHYEGDSAFYAVERPAIWAS